MLVIVLILWNSSISIPDISSIVVVQIRPSGNPQRHADDRHK